MLPALLDAALLELDAAVLPDAALLLPAAEVLPGLAPGGPARLAEELERLAVKYAKKAETAAVAQTLRGDAERFRTGAAVEGLDDQALFLLVEGLDPLCLIATDSTAAAALGRAYRCEVPLGKPGRAFGRSVVAFRDFDAMLDDGQDKQIAWALLKKLPRFGE